MDEEEIKERIEFYKGTKAKMEENLDGAEDREKAQYRIDCTQELIDRLYERLNPTGKKEMYK